MSTASLVPHTTSRSEVHPALILPLIFSALSICFIIKNLAVQYPRVIGDEYYYSILSRYIGRSSELVSHNKYLPYYPNELYLWLFHSAGLFGNNFYQFAKTLNSLLFAAAIFPIYGLSRRFLRHVPAVLLSTLIIVAPLENYTAYFMPESCYFLGFWLFAFLFLSNLPHRCLIAGILGGFALGLLTLIKPHALTVLGGANLTLIAALFVPQAFDLERYDCARCLVALNSVWLATVAMFHVVLFGHRNIDIFGFYRGMETRIPDRLVYTEQVMTVLFKHLAYVAPIFGLPVVATVLAALGLLPADRSGNRNGLRILNVFAIIVCGLLLVMASSATTQFGRSAASEFSRIHGRYYDFALPLFLISFYSLRRGKPPEKIRKPFFFGVLVCLVLVLVGWRLLARVQPIYLTDYPEMAWVTQPHQATLTVFWPVTALMLFYYGLVGLKERMTYSIYLVIALIAGSILTYSSQLALDVETPADQGSAAVRSLFDGKQLDLGLVVGSDPTLVRRCLFGIQANPWVLEIPARAVIDRHQIGKDIQWILTLDDYDLRVPFTIVLATPSLKIVRLQPPPAGVSDQIRLH
jgi:phosphoglycerol transferase